MQRGRKRGLWRGGITLALGLTSQAGHAQQTFTMPPPSVAEPAAGGIRIKDDGLVGNWYPGKRGTSRQSAILLLGGSEGGIGTGVGHQAADLVAHGFAVLQLAYFGAPGLPSKLDRIPLEYFDRALAWLVRQPDVDPRRIAIVGASKGAEATLLVAARHPEIHAVVAGAPSAVVWPGIDFSGGPTDSSWSVGNRPLPYLRYGAGTRPGDFFGGYESGLATLTTHREAAIPVARIRAKTLLVCGQSDRLWPSCPMAEIVKRDMGGRANVLRYTDAGHAVFGPPVPATAADGLGALGGSAAGNNAARADAWPKILRFLADRR